MAKFTRPGCGIQSCTSNIPHKLLSLTNLMNRKPEPQWSPLLVGYLHKSTKADFVLLYEHDRIKLQISVGRDIDTCSGETTQSEPKYTDIDLWDFVQCVFLQCVSGELSLIKTPQAIRENPRDTYMAYDRIYSCILSLIRKVESYAQKRKKTQT